MSERKKSRKQRNSEFDSILNPPEVIHVEHNLIVEWLLRLKSWIRRNKDFIQNVFVAVLVALMLAGIIIFLYTSLIEKQNYLFFNYMREYQELKKIKSDEEKKGKLKKLVKNAHELCHTFFKTSHSYNGCLIEAVAYIELEQPEKSSQALDLFGQHNTDNGSGAYILFFAAQAYENLLEFQKAYEIYHQLEELLKPVKKDDIAIFNKAKVLFLQGKLELAERMFDQVVEKFPASNLFQDAQSFLNLIAFQKGQELIKNKPSQSKKDIPNKKEVPKQTSTKKN